MQYTTLSGIQVTRTDSKIAYRRGLKHLLRKLDTQRGIYLSSNYEYPERYSRWDIAAICPPLEIVSERVKKVNSGRLEWPIPVRV